MPWIVTTKLRLAQRLANFIERRFPDAEECVDAGDGDHETRAEYRVKYRTRVFVKFHPDGLRAAIWMSATAKAKFDAIRAAIQAKRVAGTADPEEVEIDDLPPDVPSIDATWDAIVPPPGA